MSIIIRGDDIEDKVAEEMICFALNNLNFLKNTKIQLTNIEDTPSSLIE
jgi:hypothetical protein